MDLPFRINYSCALLGLSSSDAEAQVVTELGAGISAGASVFSIPAGREERAPSRRVQR
jgi:hypothetical protein